MLFNSFSFILAFLPLTLLGFFFLSQRSSSVAAGWLAGASLFFYAWWDYRYVPLLLASIVFNYFSARQIGLRRSKRAKRFWLMFPITSNLLLLGYYKYADFFLSSTNGLFNTSYELLHIVLPIGISFFTFTQIAFLVDTYQGKVAEYRFVHYVLFVTYFPHLIAGPVLHHKEMMPQFADPRNYQPNAENFAIGWTQFCFGLLKKVLLADNLAPFANALFNNPDSPSLLDAWGGLLAYSFQLYFDFSGYSDMALGLSRMFGVRLPLNFHSPYKAEDIAQFWRRWHMTLSRFLRDYLYIPLGGNRRGTVRRYFNLMLTMVLGGLWHGAGWNFAIWGGLHGCFLIIHQAWTGFSTKFKFPKERKVWRACSILLTFFCVCLAWVFFRAPNLDAAMKIIQGLFGGNGIALPDAIGARTGAFGSILQSFGVQFVLGGGSRFLQLWSWLLAGTVIAFFMPNTQEILRRFQPALDFEAESSSNFITWSPAPRWAVAVAALSVVGFLSMNHPSEFLYFQF